MHEEFATTSSGMEANRDASELPLPFLASRSLPPLVRPFDAIVTHRVGNRPGRLEPRRKKRRPKPYPLLRKPRYQARREEAA